MLLLVVPLFILAFLIILFVSLLIAFLIVLLVVTLLSRFLVCWLSSRSVVSLLRRSMVSLLGRGRSSLGHSSGDRRLGSNRGPGSSRSRVVRFSRSNSTTVGALDSRPVNLGSWGNASLVIRGSLGRS
jgi:hypothetical protein